MLEKIKHKIENAGLRKKMSATMIMVIFILSILTLTIVNYLSQVYNETIYERTADNVAVAAAIVESELDSVGSWMSTIVTDPDIQRKLSNVKDNPKENTYDVNSELYYRMCDFIQQLRSNNVAFFIIVNEQYVTECNIKRNVDMNETDIEAICSSVDITQAGSSLLTDYSDEYGLLMVQKIRRIDNSRLDELGYLIIGMDNEPIIKRAQEATVQTENCFYGLYEESEYLFGLFSGNVAEMPTAIRMTRPYEIVKIGGQRYFVVNKEIEKYNLNLYSMLLYEDIFRMLEITRNNIVIVIILCIIGTIMITGWLITGIMRHFDNLILKMKHFNMEEEEVTWKSDYDYKNRTDEIGLLHQNFDDMSDRISRLVKVNYKNEIIVQEAKFKALEMQINPHFLYNTLESINYRAKACGQRDISHMTEALGKLLHTSLSKGGSFFTIEEELMFLDAYITIQKYRFEEQLEYKLEVEDEVRQKEVPRLIIQPIVDNAIRYGLEECIDVCSVEVKIFKQDERIYIEVRNSGSQFEENLMQKIENGEVQPHGNGVGLLNINKRIHLLYGEEYGITLINDIDKAIVRICIPG